MREVEGVRIANEKRQRTEGILQAAEMAHAGLQFAVEDMAGETLEDKEAAHKAQGKTLPSAVVELGPVERWHGTTFTGLSRVKVLSGRDAVTGAYTGLAVARCYNVDRLDQIRNSEGMKKQRARVSFLAGKHAKLLEYFKT